MTDYGANDFSVIPGFQDEGSSSLSVVTDHLSRFSARSYEGSRGLKSMDRKLHILKLGTTLDTLLKERGDFEDWILSGMEISREQTVVVDVSRGDKLPHYGNCSGVVISGSHDMVTEHYTWSEQTAEWLPGLIERRIPTLGICYGHQLLAYAMGGKVGNNPRGREFGSVYITLNENAAKDHLLGECPRTFLAHVGHTQSVLRLPPGATRLAASAFDANQAYVLSDCAWGLQFHPEFDASIMIEYIRTYRDLLREDGKDPEALLRECVDTTSALQLLRRFTAIIREWKWERKC